MAVRPIPYIVSTRVVAAITTIIPLYIVTLILSFGAAKLVVLLLHGQSAGTYDFYFDAFLKPQDLAFSVIKEIGRASCRERVCLYVLIAVVRVYIKKKK